MACDSSIGMGATNPRMGSITAPDLPGRIPSLDGLRALSILLVIFGHAVTTPGAPSWLERPAFSSLGNVGVRFFFLISGFLITTLLLRDLQRYGRIRMRQFYERRAFRILPAVLCYIGVIWTLYLVGLLDLRYHITSHRHVDTALPDLIYALTFTSNYQLDYNWYFNHLWSLSVEEQFYLLWPLTLAGLGPQRGLRVAAAALALAPLLRTVMFVFGAGPEIAYTREFQAVADALATGCVTAMLHNRLSASPRFLSWLRAWGAPVGLGLVAAGYGVALVSRPTAYLLGQSAANLGIALLIQFAVRHPGSALGRLLNLRAVVAVGVLSYSLYLWQEPFLFFRNQAWLGSFPQNIAWSFVAATASYLLVERPFLRLKDRLGAAKEGGAPRRAGSEVPERGREAG
jgi:peptidoglycan/LPS O-acetylase OafA/YrhL